MFQKLDIGLISENRRMAAKNLAGQKRKAIIDWQNHEVHDN